VPPARAGGTLLLREDDLVVVVAPRRCGTAPDDEASDDIETFDLAVLEVAKAEHRAGLLFSRLVHDFPLLSGLVEPIDNKGVTRP
jgi:hypothetical protein